MKRSLSALCLCLIYVLFLSPITFLQAKSAGAIDPHTDAVKLITDEEATRELDSFGYPVKTVSQSAIRELLRGRQFRRLNLLLEGYQQEFKRDFRNEYKPYDAFESFSVADPSIKKLLDEWVDTCSDSYQPYLARANYYHALGWESRGADWSRNVSPGQFRGMEIYFSRARRDLDTVLKMNPDVVTAYGILVPMNMALGREGKNELLIGKVLDICPQSLLMRTIYMYSIEPKWGGSYKKMQKFADEARKYADANPRLNILQGYIYLAQGDTERSRGQDREAVPLYTKALSFGDYYVFYRNRANSYYHL